MSFSVEKSVVKLGTESNMDSDGVREDRQLHIVEQVAQRRRGGDRIAMVLSGAIAMANATLLNAEERADPRITQRMRATRGSDAFFSSWIAAFDRAGIRSGGFLVTHHELGYKPELESFDENVEDYMNLGWVPLINENGSTDDKETKKLVYGGDNDGLAEDVADRIGADRIYFLTEVEGVKGRDGKVIGLVDENNIEEVLDAVGEAGVPGPGAGMRTKVDAAWEAAGKGRTAHIAYAGYDFDPIRSGDTGTLFVPR